MSTTITHSCGHTVEHEQVYSEGFAARLQGRPCGECFRVAYAAEVEAAKAASADLPALAGTERQVAWATKLRLELIAVAPELRPLVRYAPEARFWIDSRDTVGHAVHTLGVTALQNDNEDALVRAVAIALRSLMEQKRAFFKDGAHEALTSILGAALMRVIGNWGHAQRVAPIIAANVDLFCAVALAPTEPSDEVRLAALRPALVDVVAQQAEASQKRMADAQRAAEAKRAAIAAEQARADEEARQAAEAKLRAAADLQARRAPYVAEMRAFAWDASDRYWTERVKSHVTALSLTEMQAHPRAIEALRVLFAAPDRDAVKALERVHPTTLLDAVLDAQRLASLVGANAARAMHVAAGLPKPVIPRKKVTA